MKTLILYSSKKGTTTEAVELLKTALKGDTYVCRLGVDEIPDISGFDNIVAGGPVYASNISKSVRDFCRDNLKELQDKKLGLFICCMDKQKEEEQLEKAFPESLSQKAVARANFGGAFDFDKMNFFEKFIIKKVIKVNSSVKRFDKDAIKSFAEEFNSQYM